jgi:hypothetical protein
LALGISLAVGALNARAQEGASPPSAAFPVEPAPAAPPSAAPTAARTDPAPTTHAPAVQPSPPPTHDSPGTSLGHDPPSARDETLDTFHPTAPLRFALAGQFVLSGALELSLSSTSYGSSPASTFDVKVHPSADYFLLENFSLGGYVFFDHRSEKLPLGGATLDRSLNAFGGGIRAGYNLPFNELFSAWLTAGLWAAKARIEQNELAGASTSLSGTSVPVIAVINQNIVGLSFYLPILLHPAPHFFVGLGPSADIELSHEVAGVSNAATTIGFGSTVGGWL